LEKKLKTVAKYKRILLKLSGEALAGERGYGIDDKIISLICAAIKDVHKKGVQIGIVIGGGNIFRGLSGKKIVDRVNADYMGMMATVINSLALQGTFKTLGVESRVLSALEIKGVVEPFAVSQAIKHLDEKKIVIFAGGTGNPFFTTDTAAALRALEIEADVLIKCTKVDGIYDKDPVTSPDAKFFRELTYDQVLVKDLKVMDATAISLCREGNLTIRVLSIKDPKNLKKAIENERVGSIVRRKSHGK
jgi:uridylate kinase